MDRALRLQILRAVTSDRRFLKAAWDDVRPTMFPAREEKLVAETAIRFYQRYEEPIGGMLTVEAEDAAKSNGHALNKAGQLKLKTLLHDIFETQVDRVSVTALIDRCKKLHHEAFYAAAVDQVIAAYEKDELNPQVLQELIESAHKELATQHTLGHDYLDTLEDRIKRRQQWDERRPPYFLIPELDNKIEGPSKGQLAMWMAPPSGGKGLALVHMSLSYALQGLNVLHITLEDPLDLVMGRMDASLTGMAISKLRSMPNRLRKRFAQARKDIRGRIRVVDGTGDEAYTVARVERVVEEFKQDGFRVDAIIIDYDDEIQCDKPFKGDSARRMEFGEIYKQLRRLAVKTDTIVWVAAQTTKAAEGMTIISMKETAEDFSKIRKCFQVFTIAYDKENFALKRVHIAKNRLGRGRFTVEIMSNYESALFYDSEATAAYNRIKRVKATA